MTEEFYTLKYSWRCGRCSRVVPPLVRHDCYTTDVAEARQVARRLLKERDEARLLITDCQDRVDRYNTRLNNLKIERDEARQQCDGLRQLCDETTASRSEYINQRDEALREVAELRRVLDEITAEFSLRQVHKMAQDALGLQP